MSYLLDTHALIWSLTEPERLSKRVRTLLESDRGDTVFFSSINLLEISIKYNLGKITLKGGTPEDIMRSAVETGFQCLSLDCLETARFYDRNFTAGDPFDRLLCHISVERGLTLITRDPFFEKVKIEGFQYFW